MLCILKRTLQCNVLYVFRKVQTESSTGSTSSNKVRTTLTVHVEGIDFDTQACMLRVKGRNIQENQYVKVSVASFMSQGAQNMYSLYMQGSSYTLARDYRKLFRAIRIFAFIARLTITKD